MLLKEKLIIAILVGILIFTGCSNREWGQEKEKGEQKYEPAKGLLNNEMVL